MFGDEVIFYIVSVESHVSTNPTVLCKLKCHNTFQAQNKQKSSHLKMNKIQKRESRLLGEMFYFENCLRDTFLSGSIFYDMIFPPIEYNYVSIECESQQNLVK